MNQTDPRGEAIYHHLVQVHALYRRQLGVLRRAAEQWLASGLDPEKMPAAARQLSPEVISRNLQVHCLHFCEALGAHHALEDAEMFPALRQAHRTAGPVIDRLTREHQRISTLLTQLVEVASQFATPDRTHALVASLTQLADELESHLDYEEQSLRSLFAAAT